MKKIIAIIALALIYSACSKESHATENDLYCDTIPGLPHVGDMREVVKAKMLILVPAKEQKYFLFPESGDPDITTTGSTFKFLGSEWHLVNTKFTDGKLTHIQWMSNMSSATMKKIFSTIPKTKAATQIIFDEKDNIVNIVE